MLEIDISGLNYGSVSNSEIVRQRGDGLSDDWNKIWEFLKNTNSSTYYYKVLHQDDFAITLNKYKGIATDLRTKYKYIVFIGMGGSILTAKTLFALNRDRARANTTFFLDTLDPLKFEQVERNIDISQTAFVITSNSGETVEAISLYLAFKNIANSQGLDIGKQCYFCVGDPNSSLNRISDQAHATLIRYDQAVGGRFCNLSNSTIFHGLVLGLDMDKYIAAYNKYLKKFWDDGSESLIARSALQLFCLKKRNMPIISYASLLEPYLEWYAQVVSESLGKNNNGYAPIVGLGPQQQHTMFEYYLDGNDDSVFTFVNYNNPPCTSYTTSDYENNRLANRTLKSLNDDMYQSSVTYFRSKGIPVRTLTLTEFNEASFAELLAFATVESIILSLLHQVHPFDNPAIDECKSFMYINYFTKA